MIKTYIRKIKCLTKDEENIIVSSLSENARARLDKKRNSELRNASLCALSLLTEEQRADLNFTEGGRPFFATLDCSIAISHSKSIAAIAISSSKSESIGIDVEDFFSVSDKITRFFTENERAEIDNGASPIEIWTKKEALFKYLKKDDIPFSLLDSTTADVKFFTVKLGNSSLTLCTHKDATIDPSNFDLSRTMLARTKRLK